MAYTVALAQHSDFQDVLESSTAENVNETAELQETLTDLCADATESLTVAVLNDWLNGDEVCNQLMMKRYCKMSI